MSTPLVFIDTETDGLHPGRKAWEIALIRRDHLGQTETHFFVGIDIRDSNPDALSIGRFWDRHPSGRKMAGLKTLPDSVNVLTQHDAAKEVMRWTFGAHLVGAIPSFDAETFARMLRSNGYLPSWHHRLYCIESIVMGHFGRPVGGLRACAEAVGVMVPDGAEHTAMGDARTVAEIWDVVMAGGAS